MGTGALGSKSRQYAILCTYSYDSLRCCVRNRTHCKWIRSCHLCSLHISLARRDLPGILCLKHYSRTHIYWFLVSLHRRELHDSWIDGRSICLLDNLVVLRHGFWNFGWRYLDCICYFSRHNHSPLRKPNSGSCLCFLDRKSHFVSCSLLICINDCYLLAHQRSLSKGERTERTRGEKIMLEQTQVVDREGSRIG